MAFSVQTEKFRFSEELWDGVIEQMGACHRI